MPQANRAEVLHRPDPLRSPRRQKLGTIFVGALACIEAVALVGASCGVGNSRPTDAALTEPQAGTAPEGLGVAAAPTARPLNAPAPPATGSPPGRIVLGSGVTLASPPGATPTTAPGGIPPEVARSNHAFKLEGGNRRLMVSELALGAERCVDRLDAEWARMKRSKDETDKSKSELRRIATIEQRQVAGRRVVWAESMQGTSLADAGAPFAATATALLCAGESLLLVMYMATEPTLDPSARATMDAMLASLRLPGAP